MFEPSSPVALTLSPLSLSSFLSFVPLALCLALARATFTRRGGYGGVSDLLRCLFHVLEDILVLYAMPRTLWSSSKDPRV